MSRAKQFTMVEKTRIQCWFHEGMSTTEMAAQLGRNAAAVRRIVASIRDLPEFAPPTPAAKRSGRPRAATFKQEKRLKNYVMANPFKTAKELKREVPGWESKSVRVIQHTLRTRLGLPSRCAAPKPLLTAPMVKKRLAFCKKYLAWTEEDWENVMF